MRYLKFQQDLLKAADARDYKNKTFRYPWFEDDTTFYICPQGHYFVAIPKTRFYLDILRIFKDLPSLQTGMNYLNQDGLKDATDDRTTISACDLKLHQFSVDGQHVYLDEENLKYFELSKSTFKGTSKKNPIYIYEGCVLVGMVLPVNHKEGGGM